MTAYVAPAVRLVELHVPDPEADDRTVCGLVMDTAEVWLPAERREGDRVCAACLGEPGPEQGSLC